MFLPFIWWHGCLMSGLVLLPSLWIHVHSIQLCLRSLTLHAAKNGTQATLPPDPRSFSVPKWFHFSRSAQTTIIILHISSERQDNKSKPPMDPWSVKCDSWWDLTSLADFHLLKILSRDCSVPKKGAVNVATIYYRQAKSQILSRSTLFHTCGKQCIIMQKHNGHQKLIKIPEQLAFISVPSDKSTLTQNSMHRGFVVCTVPLVVFLHGL